MAVFKGVVYALIAAFFYAIQPVFIKMLSQEFGLFELLFFRFLGALGVFSVLALSEEEELKKEAEHWKRFVPAGIVYALAVLLWVYGNYLASNATTVAIVSRTNIIFVALVSALLFVDEKKLLLSKKFIFGLSLAFIGSLGFVSGSAEIAIEFGVLMILASNAVGSFYSAYLKTLANHKESETSLAIILAVSFVMIAISTLAAEGVPETKNASAIAIALISGATGLGLGNYFGFKAIENLGLVSTSSLMLMIPLITASVAIPMFNETLSTGELIFGALILSGCYFVINAEFGPLHLGSLAKREFKKAFAHLH